MPVGRVNGTGFLDELVDSGGRKLQLLCKRLVAIATSVLEEKVQVVDTSLRGLCKIARLSAP